MENQYPASLPVGNLNRAYKYILNLGVDDDTPIYEVHRVRFSNFIGLFCQSFYLLYGALSFVFHSRFLTIVTLLMLVTGVTGFWFNSKKYYNAARTVFICSFSILLFVICNSLNIGFYFVFFYFPAFIAYTLYYDLEKDIYNALVNLSISVCCAVGAFLMPKQYFIAANIDEKWIPFISTFNYFLASAVTIVFVFFAVFHINKSSRRLVEVWQEAERQKQELSEAKKKADIAVTAKSRFLSNMSHEMRTPLNGIIGTVSLMMQEQYLPQQEENLKVLRYSSEHMLNVVNDVLDFSKIEADKMELALNKFNPREMFDNLYTVFKNQFEAKGVNLLLDIDEQLSKNFISDETRLKQVLTNMIANAMKFTHYGVVKVEAKLQSFHDKIANIYFSIKDTGIGISEEHQQVIFDAFNQAESSTTRKYGGTGLGLTISKKIVTNLGGDLMLESKPGEGSHFFFTIPMAASEENEPTVKKAANNHLCSLQGIRVLVAEDSPINMNITRQFLKRWDIVMHEAVNGEEAVKLFQENEYDVLLIDLDMPIMDGYEALAGIREMNQQIPVIAFTAAVLPQMKENLESKGFNDFLQKPFLPQQLHEKLAHYSKKSTGTLHLAHNV
jgi:signal transduction histidine kinase